jgi:nitrogen fixation protein NifU and related proteins
MHVQDSELRELYQEVILDHRTHPHNFRELPHATHRAAGFNPFCGDRVEVYLVLDGGRIREAAFRGSGCAISTASASIMTDVLKGKTAAEAECLCTRFRALVAGTAEEQADRAGEAPELGELYALAGVRKFPVRVKCATLTWHTMLAALHEDHHSMTTE